MSSRVLVPALVLTAALAVTAAPAAASLADEVTQGQQIASQLQAGTTSCSKLSDSDFEHLGEYVMERMVGSRSAHQAMNERMGAAADRMHEAMGRRFAGCGGSAYGPGAMMGGGMMGSGAGPGAMMGGGGWMMNGTGGHGWSTAAIVIAVLLALLLGGLIVFAIARRPNAGGHGQSQPV